MGLRLLDKQLSKHERKSSKVFELNKRIREPSGLVIYTYIHETYDEKYAEQESQFIQNGVHTF